MARITCDSIICDQRESPFCVYRILVIFCKSYPTITPGNLEFGGSGANIAQLALTVENS